MSWKDDAIAAIPANNGDIIAGLESWSCSGATRLITRQLTLRFDERSFRGQALENVARAERPDAGSSPML